MNGQVYFGKNVKGFQRIDVIGNPYVCIWIEPYREGYFYGTDPTHGWGFCLFVPRILALPEVAS